MAEFLILLGLFAVQPWLCAVAALGLISAAIYALWMMQQTFQGEPDTGRQMRDFNGREMLAMTTMIVALIGLGLYPQPVLDLVEPTLYALQQEVRSDVIRAFATTSAAQ